jgi:SNF2 family DNA or RNA helicase
VLELAFSTFAGKVRVSCDLASAKSLQALSSRYATSTAINQLTFELELDDLLANLVELAHWPEQDPDVHWQKELLQLVEANAADTSVLQSMLGDEDAAVDAPSVQLDGAWKGPLTEFQQQNIKKLLVLLHGANFSVPGAGKTRVTLAVFHARRLAGEVRRMLIVCPKSAYESWQSEAKQCFVDAPQVAVMDTAIPPPADIVLINYERLPDARPSLSAWLRSQPALLVLDEAHRMKLGAQGAWGAACLALGPYAVRRMILSGTPAPNGAKDLENLFSFVWPGLGKNEVIRALAGNDLRQASARLQPLFVRTTKKQLALPPVDIVVRRIELPPLHRELYNALVGQASARFRSQEDDVESLGKVLLYLLMAATTPALLAVGSSPHEPLPYRVPPLLPPPNSSLKDLMRDLPQYELSPKFQEVVKIVASNAEQGRKTLVWSTFVRNLKSLESLLSRFRPALIHGGTEDRDKELSRFRNDPSCFVLLSNAATLGEGVSLHQDCHDAVYVDRDFSAGRFLQSVDRIHRLGLPKDTETRVTVLSANQTIDELVEQRLKMKLDFMGGVLDDPAVLALSDLDEEPSAAIGMDHGDLASLIGYLSSHASS